MATTLDADCPAPRYTPHELITAFAISCTLGGLLTDFAYWKSAEFLWADFSAWLVSASAVAMVVALVAVLIDYLIFRSHRRMPPLFYVAVGLTVLILATLNMMVHSRDAWTSVVPWGLALSAVTVLVLLGAAIWRTVELRRACREVQP